jgi:serine/threonine protein kinase
MLIVKSFVRRSVLSGVKYLHHHDIVHRDLKFVFLVSCTHPTLMDNVDQKIYCIESKTITVISSLLISECEVSLNLNDLPLIGRCTFA